MFPLTIRAKRSRRSGFVLITMALASVGTLAVVGLAVDVGRLVCNSERASVLHRRSRVIGSLKLNGTSSG